MDELYVPDPTLLRAAAVGVALWFLLLAVVRVVRGRGVVKAGPPSTDLGMESPALVNFLTHDFSATPDAVPATLLDLAARGVVEIEDRGIGNYFCRLRAEARGANDYEQKLVDHLRDLEADGVVPAEALTTGPQEQSRAWWTDFRKKVIEEARDKGLSENLWSAWTSVVLFLAGAPVALLYGFATGFRDSDDVQDSWLLHFTAAGVTLGGFVLLWTIASARQRGTDEGRSVASRWRGVARALEDSPSFARIPPSGVVVWERHLAYATALGVAPRAARSLPMGAESDTEAWTSASGDWRKVSIRYPRFRPGWGRNPLIAIVVGAVGIFVGYQIARFSWSNELAASDPGWLHLVQILAITAGLVVLGRSVVELLWALGDLGRRKEISGHVLRCRTRGAMLPLWTQSDEPQKRYFVAIDDGSSDRVAAFRVGEASYPLFRQGDRVTIEVTPRLGYLARDPSAEGKQQARDRR